MLNIRRFIVAFICVGALSVPGSVAAAGAAKGTAASRHSLWKVQGSNCTVYLLGSVHFLTKTNYPLAPVIEAAYQKARSVAFETDLDQMESPEVQMKLLSQAMLPAGETLSEKLSVKNYANFTNHLAGAGLPETMFDRFKPAMAAITLTVLELQKLGFDPQHGIDRHFHDRAGKDGKEIIALETIDFQLDLITGLTGEEGDLLIQTTLEQLAKSRKMFGDIIQAWQAGDADALEKLLNEALRETPKIEKRLLTDRNLAWLPRIESLLRGNKDAIVIVGAAHLVGKQGVVELLKAKRYRVNQE